MYGVIDIGSNTMRLSIYKRNEQDLTLMFHKKNAAGLAGYIDAKGCLTEDGINKAVDVLQGFSQLIENIGLKDVYAFATASLRNVANSEAATHEISSKAGMEIEVLSGEQEGMYDFIGATRYMSLDRGLMVDIGGGSTELVSYYDGKINRALSIPIGSLNLYLKHVNDILPSQSELNDITQSVDKQLDMVQLSQPQPIICGVGGTARNLCKLNNQVFRLNASNRTIKTENLRTLLIGFSEDRKLAQRNIIKVAPDRIHTMLPGMVILDRIAERIGSEFIQVSEQGIREGYLYYKLFNGGK
jgi:exopolyphosphatase / guanosine-5'-triphosphate,3'-diphosphate pyrophosphatase